jgi:hypothetical protein
VGAPARDGGAGTISAMSIRPAEGAYLDCGAVDCRLEQATYLSPEYRAWLAQEAIGEGGCTVACAIRKYADAVFPEYKDRPVCGLCLRERKP